MEVRSGSVAGSHAISGLTLQVRSLGTGSDRVEDAVLYEVNGLPTGGMVLIRRLGERWRIQTARPVLSDLASEDFDSPTEALVYLHANLL